MLPELCLGLVMLGIAAYAVLGSADFGAGFWDLTAGGDRRGGRIRGMVQRSMSPVWEANHVWLIFVLVMVWTAFPVAFGSVFSTLFVPLALAAIGIIFRGAAFALRGQAATIREARVLGALFASSSVLIPFCLGAALGGVASGRVPVGNAAGDAWSSWLNPTSMLAGVLGIVTGAHLAAVYLTGDSQRAGLDDLVRAFRKRALATGVLAGAIALAGLLVVRSDARDLFDGLTSGGALACVLVSGATGVATLALVARRALRPRAPVGGRLRRGDPRRLGARAGPVPAAAGPHAGGGGGAGHDAHRAAGRRRHRDGRAHPVARAALPPRAARHARPELRAARPALPADRRRAQPMSRRRAALPLGCFLVGVTLMIGFETTITRILGMALLFGFIVSGVFAIADPEALGEDGDD